MKPEKPASKRPKRKTPPALDAAVNRILAYRPPKKGKDMRSAS